MKTKVAVVIPNWNGEDFLATAIESLLAQTLTCTVIVVDNGSVDGSRAILMRYRPRIVTLLTDQNEGFTGGVNRGIRWALENDYEAIGLLNVDAAAEAEWLARLLPHLSGDVGVVTGSMVTSQGTLEGSGLLLSHWGLPCVRDAGARLKDMDALGVREVFGASGGASLYSSRLLKDVGLFDDDFFAYYEDSDLSFRVLHRGYRTLYVPEAVVQHVGGAISGRIRGFYTYQTFKNSPLVLIKNLPSALIIRVWPRFLLAQTLYLASALQRGQLRYALKGTVGCIGLLPKKFAERTLIQQRSTLQASVVWQLLFHDVPPDKPKIRAVRSLLWRIVGPPVKRRWHHG